MMPYSILLSKETEISMNILIFEYEHMAIEDLCEALTNLGHTYTVITDEQIYDRANNAFAARFDKHIESASYDAVFTFNYFPIISNCCKKHNIPYIAFVYDSPLVSLYSYTIINPCNYVFLFDQQTYLELKKRKYPNCLLYAACRQYQPASVRFLPERYFFCRHHV